MSWLRRDFTHNTSQSCNKSSTSQGWGKASTSQCCGTAPRNAVSKSAPHVSTVPAARSRQQHTYVCPSSGARLVHLSIPACRLLVLAKAPCIQAALLHGSTFGVVLAARISSGAHARCVPACMALLGCSTLQVVLAARSGSNACTSYAHASLAGCLHGHTHITFKYDLFGSRYLQHTRA